MTRQPQVTVVIPAYQAEATIDRCLDALAHQTLPRGSYEVVVVDDGSSDNTQTRAKAHAGVSLVTQPHAGPAMARNHGVKHARGEIVLFTDSDCEPTVDWLARMVAPFRDKGITGVKGVYRTRQKEIVARFVQIEYEEKYDRMAGEAYIDFVDTYSAGYRRVVFLANGGFDTSFPYASVEDQEFSFRLARQGHKMVYAPEAIVYHWGHAHNLRSYWRRKFRIGFWKVVVHRRHPDKLLRDSHTPQTLKAQILLVGLGGVFLVGGLLWPPFRWLLGLAGLLYLVTTVPFAAKALAKDRQVAVLSPGLLFVRALALGTGFAAGLLASFTRKRPKRWIGTAPEEPKIAEQFARQDSSSYDNV